jgi:hypothetical protein
MALGKRRQSPVEGPESINKSPGFHAISGQSSRFAVGPLCTGGGDRRGIITGNITSIEFALLSTQRSTSLMADWDTWACFEGLACAAPWPELLPPRTRRRYGFSPCDFIFFIHFSRGHE